MLMTAADYRESLRALKPRVFVNGRQVASVADEPLLAPGINAIGLTYDFAQRAEYAALMTATQQGTERGADPDCCNGWPHARHSSRGRPAHHSVCHNARVMNEIDDQPRLSKRMSELGLCSRREAEQWIVNGWVRVDGRIVDVLGTRISREAKIEIDQRARVQQDELVTVILNKPIGYVSGQAEDGYEPATVLIRPENRWSGDDSGKRFDLKHLQGLAPAGRLDIDSTGLMVYTQDGRIAKQLIGGNDVEKEYLVRVQGMLSDEGLARLRHGLTLDGVKL